MPSQLLTDKHIQLTSEIPAAELLQSAEVVINVQVPTVSVPSEYSIPANITTTLFQPTSNVIIEITGYGPVSTPALFADGIWTELKSQTSINDNNLLIIREMFRSFINASNLTDTLSFNVNKAIDESTSIADVLNLYLQILKTDETLLIEALALNANIENINSTVIDDNNLLIIREMFRSFIDTLALADMLSFDVNKAINESTSIADIVSLALEFFRTLDDATLLIEALTLNANIEKIDASALTEILVFVTNKAITDNTIIFEEIAIDTTKSLSDLTNLIDNLSIVLDVFRQLNDSTTIADSNTFSIDIAPLDTSVIIDLFNLAISKVSDDNTILEDAINIAFSKELADSTVLSEIISLSIDLGIALNDAASLFEIITLNATIEKLDNTILTETGTIGAQNYIDPTFFSQDYVGSWITF